MSTLSYHFYEFLFALTPTFCPSPWRPPAAVAAVTRCHNHASDNPVETRFPLLCSLIQYSRWDASLSAAPMQETEIYPPKPPFPSRILSKISRPMRLIFSSRVSTSAVLVVPHISCHSHPPPTPSSNIFFVVPSSRLSSTSLLLLSRSPDVSAAVATA